MSGQVQQVQNREYSNLVILPSTSIGDRQERSACCNIQTFQQCRLLSMNLKKLIGSTHNEPLSQIHPPI